MQESLYFIGPSTLYLGAHEGRLCAHVALSDTKWENGKGKRDLILNCQVSRCSTRIASSASVAWGLLLRLGQSIAPVYSVDCSVVPFNSIHHASTTAFDTISSFMGRTQTPR
jgi:hypothetical protein